MADRRVAPALLAGVGLVLVATGPAAARPATDTARFIYGLSDTLLLVAVPVTLFVEGVLFYAIWRYRRNDEPTPTRENRRLEVGWTVATAVILVFVGLSAYSVMAHPSVTTTPTEAERLMQGGDPVVVNVTGAQWFWTFDYAGQNVTTQTALVLPAGRPIVLRITSTDVIHSVFVPGLGIKKDAIPGRTNYQVTTIVNDSVGRSYQLFCVEFCGTGLSDMLAAVNAVSPSDFQPWLANQRSGGNTTASGGGATPTPGGTETPTPAGTPSPTAAPPTTG